MNERPIECNKDFNVQSGKCLCCQGFVECQERILMDKNKLKEELVDLRMHLANAEIQANKIKGLLPLKWGLSCKFRWHIQEADDELCDIARAMKLDKIDLVKPGRAN